MRTPAHIARALAQVADNRSITSHQAFIQALPCVACGKPAPSECAQVWRGPGLGNGSAARERYLLPLCGPATVWQDCCHSQRYFLGQTRFWSRLGIDPLRLADLLWRISGDVRGGERLVRHARQAIAASGRYRTTRGGQVAPTRRATRSYPQSLLPARHPVRPQSRAKGEAAPLLGGGL
jgi:hypothetical protein